ncbi:MAG TPA: response regulator [Pirellulales bacterium]|jgi:diguanylate cyclase (GGDEF)-like protein|nr:response regulator [Pirellulales bacterium]
MEMPSGPGSVGSPTQAAATRLSASSDSSIVRRTTPAEHGEVLVVEDDPRSARMICAHLQAAGYRTMIAGSALEAQQCVERALPDLILCDVCMPDIDGIQLTTWMRARFASTDLPIALLTSSDDRKILTRGLDAGADDFLSKPVNSLELRTRVRSLLRTKMMADELRDRAAAAQPFAAQQGDSHELAMNASGEQRPIVLVVEDNAQERRLLERQLTELDCSSLEAGSGGSGLRLFQERAPDLVVLDLLLPDQSGYEFIAAIKADPRHARVPILVVSAMAEVQDRVKALELGADDFIVKGFHPSEFEARVRRLLRLKRSIDRLKDHCTQAMRLAVTDGLTGLYTHGFMQETLKTQLSLAQRYGKPYSVIFADIDRFKQVNDRYGHATGDIVLRAVAQALSTTVRQSDTLVRYGGEEFTILLPQTSRDAAVRLAERMRETVANLAIPIDREHLHVTLSLGVANYPDDAADGNALIRQSDAAMYLAKRSGRNRVATLNQDPAQRRTVVSILLVDDDERNVRLLEAYLTPEGYQLLSAADGAEAVDVALKHRPDLIVMDALMPTMSGFEACALLKEDPRTQLIPVLLVTSLSSREDKLRGIESGADDFINKPIDKTQLCSRIRVLLRHKRDTDDLEDAETIIFALARAVEGRDPSLGDHVERVANYAVSLGHAIKLCDADVAALRRAAIVHDIGKISVPDPILFKQGALTPEERDVLRQHPQTGHNLLQLMRTFNDSLAAVRFHHERLDGSGYPLGLRGSEVPLLAQVLAIADVYDALTSCRHYRAALPREKAIEILRDEAHRGLHDVDLVETFVREVIEANGTPRSCSADQSEPVTVS